MRILLSTVLFSAIMAWSASAAILYVDFVPVNNSAGSPDTDGFNSMDLMIETDTDWLAGNLIVTLSSGSIFQSAFGGNTAPPAPAIITAFPSSAFDTYVSGKNGTPASSDGGAVDIGGTAAGEFSTSAIDINWFTTATDDIGTFTLGRLSLSDDSRGTLWIGLSTAGGSSLSFCVPIESGTLLLVFCPEPSALGLLAVGATAVLGRRRARG